MRLEHSASQPQSSRVPLTWLSPSCHSPVDAQQLSLQEVQARVLTQRSLPPPTRSPDSSHQFVGRTVESGVGFSQTISNIQSLLNSPPNTGVALTGSRSNQNLRSPSSPVFNSLPMSPIRQNFMQCSASQSSSSSQPTPTHASAIPDASFDSDHLQVAKTLPRVLASDTIRPALSIDQPVPSVCPRMGKGERQLKKATKDNKFKKDIMTFLDHCDKEIKRIAAEHSKPLLTVKKLVGVHRRFREQRAPSLYNALMHQKSEELNAQGVKLKTLHKKHQVMAEDINIQAILADPGCDEAESAIHELCAYQNAKISGARASAKANDNDIAKTWSELTHKAQNLSKRTSAATFGFICGSKAGQHITCQFFGNGPIEAFLLSKFGLTGAEFIEAVEAYFIFLSSGRTSTNMGVKAMRKETVKLILEGLKNITRNDKICMEYEHYEVLIIKERCSHGNPHNLNAAHAISLYQAVKSKTCMWKPLDRMELHRVRRSIEARVDSGDLAIPERLRRGKGGAESKSGRVAGKRRRDSGDTGVSVGKGVKRRRVATLNAGMERGVRGKFNSRPFRKHCETTIRSDSEDEEREDEEREDEEREDGEREDEERDDGEGLREEEMSRTHPSDSEEEESGDGEDLRMQGVRKTQPRPKPKPIGKGGRIIGTHQDAREDWGSKGQDDNETDDLPEEDELIDDD
ncbi:hypothetical protein DFH05DRAFT_1462615 [Lentinula detonsa]|uniref:Uncharacterized protein n=1 Tax=Lentinula detonsa TaxID=2804962 RepID=A0A9W8NVD8_9AGAR|nr:hypothetical protein DFH05DRAFT_1462615 [Lentinula detonsa]